MNPEERESQERTLAKLQWLNERCKVDFRGNPPPFETQKTLKSVEHSRRARARALAGGTDFLPFRHGTKPLALDATRSDYIRVDHPAAPPCGESARAPYGAQAIDPATGLTEVQLALSWSTPHPAAAQARCTPPGPPEFPATSVKYDVRYLQTLSPKERTAALRAQLLEHPKCTPEGTRAHHARWAASSQLSTPIASPPPRHPPNAALRQRNSIRVVHLLRSS
ncbi:hypothetical protein NESM_000583500 [Novymonas esmeraldas]|uniref:Uncharacterized protein n=1 Tax=Novymonas esmeraldas TaxID=1808958 RepID=A0AAW0ESF3_9TRYP